MKTCVLIDGHALIKALGKPNGCQTFGEYADAFFNVVRRYFDRNISRVDVVFDRYMERTPSRLALEQRGLARQNQSERLLMGHMFHFHMYGANFISMDENKSDTANFLSEMIMQKGEDLPERWELVTGGGFSSPTDARSTRRGHCDL